MRSTSTIVASLDPANKRKDNQTILLQEDNDDLLAKTRERQRLIRQKELEALKRSRESRDVKTYFDTTDTPLPNGTPYSGGSSSGDYFESETDSSADEDEHHTEAHPEKQIVALSNISKEPSLTRAVTDDVLEDSEVEEEEEVLSQEEDELTPDVSPKQPKVSVTDANVLITPLPSDDPKTLKLSNHDIGIINEIINKYLDKLSNFKALLWQTDQKQRVFNLQGALGKVRALINSEQLSIASRLNALSELSALFDQAVFESVGNDFNKLREKTWLPTINPILSDYLAKDKFTLAIIFNKYIEQEKAFQSDDLTAAAEQKIFRGINNGLIAIKSHLTALCNKKPADSVLDNLQKKFNGIFAYAFSQVPARDGANQHNYPHLTAEICDETIAKINKKSVELYAAVVMQQAGRSVKHPDAYRRYNQEYLGMIREASLYAVSDLFESAIAKQPDLAVDFDFMLEQIKSSYREYDAPNATAKDFANISQVSVHYLKSLKSFIEQFWQGDSQWQLLAQKFQKELEKFKKHIDNPQTTLMAKLIAANEVLEVFQQAIIVRVGHDIKELKKHSITTEALKAIGVGTFKKISIKDIFSHFRENGQQSIENSIKNILDRLDADSVRDFVYYKNFTYIYFQFGNYIIKLWEFLMQKPEVEPYQQRIACDLMDALATHRSHLGKMLGNHHKKLNKLKHDTTDIDHSIAEVNKAVATFNSAILIFMTAQYQRDLKPTRVAIDKIADQKLRAFSMRYNDIAYNQLMVGDSKGIFIDVLRQQVNIMLRVKVSKSIEEVINNHFHFLLRSSNIDSSALVTACKHEISRMDESSDYHHIMERIVKSIPTNLIDVNQQRLVTSIKVIIKQTLKDLQFNKAMISLLEDGAPEFDDQKDSQYVNQILTVVQNANHKKTTKIWNKAVNKACEAVKQNNNNPTHVNKFLLQNCSEPYDPARLESIMLNFKRDDEPLIKGMLTSIKRQRQSSALRERKILARKMEQEILQQQVATELAGGEQPLAPLYLSTKYRARRMAKTAKAITPPRMITQSRSCVLQPLPDNVGSPDTLKLSPPLTTDKIFSGNSRGLLTFDRPAPIISLINPNSGQTSMVREVKESSPLGMKPNRYRFAPVPVVTTTATPVSPITIPPSKLLLKRRSSNGVS
jgi:hypothetical protein